MLAQHHSKMNVEVDVDTKTLYVTQELTYKNETSDTIKNIVLNDWINGYSSKRTALAARFSDEFDRSFHLAKEKERGAMSNLIITDKKNNSVPWARNNNFQDVISFELNEEILPNQTALFSISYTIKIPSDKFTKYGYDDKGKMYLKNCFLSVARWENKDFIKYDNLNLDDCANAPTDYEITFKISNNFDLISDLNEIKIETQNEYNNYTFEGKNRLDFTFFITNEKRFELFRNSSLDVVTDMHEKRLTDIQRALTIDKVVNYIAENLGNYPFSKITVAQADYDRNPLYGLSQLPRFISPFETDFLFEIKFLKTYLNNYLHTILKLDPRKDNWIYDGIQIYWMIKYMETFYPETKMMGNVAQLKLFKGYNIVSADFNDQYSYLYLLMARKNLDQPLSNPKNTLIRFNDKIASKYKAGLILNYLDSYIGNDYMAKSIQDFIILNKTSQTTQKDFETILISNTKENISWFFEKMIHSRAIIDYKFNTVKKSKDKVSFSLINKTDVAVPVSIYGVKGNTIVSKKWISTVSKDSVYAIPRNGANKIVINYEKEIPEFNFRNNWHSLSNFKLSNRPLKFNFFKDLENPNYNQILYVPTLEYNLYDGFQPGIRFYNKTILDKPFVYDFNPTISTKTNNFSGKGIAYFNQFNRGNNLYAIRYAMSGHYLHYAPDANYTKLAPTILFYFRPSDLRDNRRETFIIKEIIVDKEKTDFTLTENTENYQIFNAKYFNVKTEVTQHVSFMSDFQYSNQFGKLAFEFAYRKLFNNKRSINLRFFTGTFLYNKTKSNYFDFGLDRPSDYLFESDYLGRSETEGIYSQQSIIADGFFKSKLETRTVNQWMATANINYTLWNWIDVYSDIGLIKNKLENPKFVYDSGIRFNLVTDFFEIFFPVYSANGWEIAENNYGERVRFIIGFTPETIINLFTRKWF